MKKIIATDVDGVIIKWQSGLPFFAQKYNLDVDHILKVIIADKFVSAAELFNCEEELACQLMEKYNTSDFIRYLSPYSDALEVINRMKDDVGFVAVSALGTKVDSLLNRKFNLNSLFPGAFDDVFICDRMESKSGLLEKVSSKYGNRVLAYIDDMPAHIDTAGAVNGNIDLLWMPRGSGMTRPIAGSRTVRDWYDVERIINEG